MSVIIEAAQPLDDDEIIGLEDGEKTVLKCSACAEPLVEIWVTKPWQSVAFKYKAMCPHCGDHSFVKEISGGVHVGSVGKTVATHFEIDDDVVVWYCVAGEVNNEDV